MRTHPQVEGGAVGEAGALDPAVGGVHLGVPAVLRVVRHLVLQVLPETQPRWVDADARLRRRAKNSWRPISKELSYSLATLYIKLKALWNGIRISSGSDDVGAFP